MALQETISKAKESLESGEFWRAKEIIRSSFGNYGYSQELYKLYAEVLLQMHDHMQAGKYLFFSKENLNEEEKKAVALYVNRHGKDGYYGIITNATAIPYRKLSEYPSCVQKRLRELGAKEELYGVAERITYDHKDTIIGTGCLLILLLLIGCMLLGAYTLAQWIF